MKAEILILLERQHSIEEIHKLTGYQKALIYYYNKKFKQGCAKIQELKNKPTV